jgi:hypothetical protein
MPISPLEHIRCSRSTQSVKPVRSTRVIHLKKYYCLMGTDWSAVMSKEKVSS